MRLKVLMPVAAAAMLVGAPALAANGAAHGKVTKTLKVAKSTKHSKKTS